MSPRLKEGDWDLTPVIDLIYSLSTGGEESDAQTPGFLCSSYPERTGIPLVKENSNVRSTQLGNFDKIWQYLGQPVDLFSSNGLSAPQDTSIKNLNSHHDNRVSPLKEVKWRDELEGANLVHSHERQDTRDLSSLTKTERKKLRRRERRREQAKVTEDGESLHGSSADESGKEVPVTPTPDRKAVIHEILHGKPPSPMPPSRLRSGKNCKSEAAKGRDAWPTASPEAARKDSQIFKPQRESAFAVAAAKKAKLIAMLTETFIDERQYLSNISYIQYVGTNTKTPADGIHIFVDASNIMIGFHDALKFSRGQSLNHRIRRQPLSFHSLSLILERGRPIAKRIVVGSDNFPAISEAKDIGYETNILDRVHKAKELTPRQKRFMKTGNGTGTGTGSGSETTAAVQYAPEKWVEQAVDEILHLKMMESIVDASEPSTMVLATGDAAEAEYSAGFLKMVERALGKGWKVELACFKHNMSGSYKRKEFRQTWGERFRIVELDGFVEVLLGSE